MNELLKLLAKGECTVKQVGETIVIEPGKKEEAFAPNIGDIVRVNVDCDAYKRNYIIVIFKGIGCVQPGISLNGNFLQEIGISEIDTIVPATEEDKAELVAKMKEEGKQWNEEKKCIEDLPYQPKDKELVWAWDDDDVRRLLSFYDAKNRCCFNAWGERDGSGFYHYAPYEGEWPVWAREAVNKLED